MEKKKLDSLFEAFSIVCSGRYVYVCDIKANISRWSKSAVEYFGLPSEYMYDAESIWVEHLHPDDREYFSESIGQIFSGKASNHLLEYQAKTRAGNYVVVVCHGVVMRDENGNPEFFCGTIKNHDCVNYIDDVTNLRSLYGFLDDINTATWNKKPLSMVMVAVEEFSRINDIFGYSYGNRVLRKFGSLLMTLFRREGVVYRMDGPKFAVLATNSTIEKLKNIFNEVQYVCAKNFYVGSDRVTLSLCAGALYLNEFEVSADSVYSCLQYASHFSKASCHGELFVFNDSVGDDKRNSMARLNVIRRSIVDNCEGFKLFYQPVVDAKTEKLKGAEALVRWENEFYGLVPPNLFVPILESDSLFPELGKWILKQAMNDCKRICETYPDFVMNVNLSYAQLERSDFTKTILGLLRETGLPPKNLCLEITERCRLLNLELLKKVFETLRNAGINVALDDFGTGYSSLGLLREFGVDTVKIDRGFVLHINESKTDQNTVRFIADLAKSFDAKVCVEGIESSEMRTALLPFQVNSLQGFFYSKPIPLNDFCQKYMC